jgi:threonine dehydrogenase-like Zn-dependent dehydrogenase
MWHRPELSRERPRSDAQKKRVPEKFLINTLTSFVFTTNYIVESGKVKVDEIVTREIPIRDYQKALDFAFAREGIKIAIIP